MTEEEHLGVARHLNELGRQFYESGGDDAVAAGEMWWGAVNRIINAIALRHRLDSGGRLPRRGVVMHHLVSNHTADRQAGINLRDRMQAAGALHGHFYYSNLDATDWAESIADTQAFIAELLELYNAGVSGT